MGYENDCRWRLWLSAKSDWLGRRLLVLGSMHTNSVRGVYHISNLFCWFMNFKTYLMHFPVYFVDYSVYSPPMGHYIGDRAFPIAAARTWNSLPPEVTSSRSLPSFKSKLKTHLFKFSFPHSWLCKVTEVLLHYPLKTLYHIIFIKLFWHV